MRAYLQIYRGTKTDSTFCPRSIFANTPSTTRDKILCMRYFRGMQRKDRADNASKGCSGKDIRYLSQVVTRPRLHAGCSHCAPTLHPHCNPSHSECTRAAISKNVPYKVLLFECSGELLQLGKSLQNYCTITTSPILHIYFVHGVKY